VSNLISMIWVYWIFLFAIALVLGWALVFPSGFSPAQIFVIDSMAAVLGLIFWFIVALAVLARVAGGLAHREGRA
jgi:hypothetical protein